MKNKSTKRILTLLLAAVMVLGCAAGVNAVFSAGKQSTVTYENGVLTIPNSDPDAIQYTTSDLFDNFKGVMPGDELFEQVEIKNDSGKKIKVYMWPKVHESEAPGNTISDNVLNELQADGRNKDLSDLDYMNDFLSQLTMTVWKGEAVDDAGKERPDTEAIYHGPASGTDWKYDQDFEVDGKKIQTINLGQIGDGNSVKLSARLAVPLELGNAYDDRIGEVDWVFSVTEVSGGNGPGGGGGGTPEFTDDHVAYIIGYPDGNVHPEANITRAEVVTILFRLLAEESRAEYWSQTNEFTDVISTNWFNNAVSTLTNAGIINGYEDGTFRPNEPITRAEFAALVARFSEAAQQMTTDFVDVNKEHWAFAEIAKAESLGWIKGYPDSTFKPNQNITRAEAMTLTNRVLERAVEAEYLLKDMIKWPDNADTKAWYYIDVQEATNSHDYDRLTKKVEGLNFAYEKWLKLKPVPDWQSLENTWSTAYVQK